ncbi:DUF447 domain-containing protein [Candidatus Formimonas warabiya]|uniref:DUF447 family protein n=1 Tax=Formimonas warabiya TaxID=1761012 RepID=A0A3G1KNH5_FORW1|nr:DUF447 domain-containing protein [Candidatus Formimonas warabiya]ATW24041.1 hypothetical protein DCMF_03875 [Candidatus Formimonas warabiya]
MIIETILSSINKKGEVNFAPMGVHIPDHAINLSKVKEICLYLYSGSHTFDNLQTTLEGVINLTNDVMAFVETALFSTSLPTAPSRLVHPPRMAGAKTIWEFSVTDFHASVEPAKVLGKIKYYEELAGFSGLCRAQGAVLEAAIAATRWRWMTRSKIEESWAQWRETVERTGGSREQEAFSRVCDFFAQNGIDMGDAK